MRIEPEQKRDEKTRRLLSRKCIRRADENQKHPADYWHPTIDQAARFHVQTKWPLYGKYLYAQRCRLIWVGEHRLPACSSRQLAETFLEMSVRKRKRCRQAAGSCEL